MERRKTDIVTNTSGNVTLGSLDVNTFYRLKETQAPDGYRTPNNYHYFVISDNSHSYTASGVPDFKSTDTFSEYKLAEGQMFGSFYYYCENTPMTTLTTFSPLPAAPVHSRIQPWAAQ